MVLLWGDDGVMLYYDAYSAFAGGRHPAILGSKVRERWPEVAAFNDDVMTVGLAGGTLHDRDQERTLHLHGSPEQVWTDLDYSPVPGEDDEPAGVLCVLAETTGRVTAKCRRGTAKAALRAERDRSQGVLDNMGEAFVLFDDEFRIADMTAKAMRLAHRPREAILGRTHWKAHPDAAPELGEPDRVAMRERRAVGREHRYGWPDGRDTGLTCAPTPSRAGPRGFSGTSSIASTPMRQFARARRDTVRSWNRRKTSRLSGSTCVALSAAGTGAPSALPAMPKAKVLGSPAH